MDALPKPHHKEHPPSLASPNSSSSSSSSSSSNGVPNPTPPLPPPAAISPRPCHRSEPTPNGAATTFVQADTTSFKHVVQMLTGAAAGAAPADPGKVSIPPIKTAGPKKPSFKLYERRSSMKNVKLSPLLPGGVLRPAAGGAIAGFSPRQTEILSPSVLDFPSLVLSPVTPLIHDPFNRPLASPLPAPANDPAAAEERAIAEKGFYLHPSPRTTAHDPAPRLLPLFPVTSPKVASGSSS